MRRVRRTNLVVAAVIILLLVLWWISRPMLTVAG
jgi:hypothetical protein